MKSILILFLMVCCISTLDDRPVIGILTIPEDDQVAENSPAGVTFIHSQYVKYVEQAGAMAIPIHYDSSPEQIDYIMDRINGVLFTGGALDFVDPDTGKQYPYTKTAAQVYEKVKVLNDNGVNFPLLGIWMGHQLIMYLESGDPYCIDRTDSGSISDPLKYLVDPMNTKLFSDMPGDLIEASTKKNITANAHSWSVLKERFFGDLKLNETFDLISISYDRNGKSYWANTESKYYPIFTSQYHPEMTQFTFAYKFLNHSPSAVEFMYQIALKFVGEARKNKQSFSSHNELVRELVQTQGFSKLTYQPHDVSDNYYFGIRYPEIMFSE